MRTAILVTLVSLFVVTSAIGQKCAENARVVEPALSTQARDEFTKNLTEAKAAYSTDPNSADAIIWLGRRTAYLGQYKEAIRIFSEGIRKFPADARMYRHRGHRNITLRCFDDAIADLEKAAALTMGKPDEIEPDGLPNAKGIPTSTLQSNIYYHLALAHYLRRNFNKAAQHFMNSYNRGFAAKSPDMMVAAAYWVYMSSARYGKKLRGDADGLLAREIRDDLEIIENHDYYKLIKLNKGLIKPETLLSEIKGDAITLGSASLGYGIGNYFLYNGDKEKAMTIFRKIVEGNQWASFGYIAAEAELKS
ncbi:MAG TPA: hypothetical protein PKD26_01480 [Pyrinomonadaceae bacterium]|nr:hypothetical protein [Pyrinomonadaceae bacterium]